MRIVDNCPTVELYWMFFEKYPDQSNPTDLNTPEKFEFAMKIGFPNYHRMQIARKKGEAWTKIEACRQYMQRLMEA